MRSKCFLVGLALVTILVLSRDAYGCSCMGGQSPCLAFGSAAAVFVGTATGVKVAPPRSVEEARKETEWVPAKVFTFQVEQTFLGVAGTVVEVGTGSGASDCGYSFVTGQRYLVYAYRSDKGDRLSTSICTNTKSYEQADQDLQFLGKLRSTAQGVTIYGEVKRQLNSVKTGNPTAVGMMADISLVVEGEGSRKEIRTDAQGRYSLSGLSPGKYEVTLSLPDELTAYLPKKEVTIADHGCAAVNYYVADNGRISGRIVDAEGQPVTNVLVALFEMDGLDSKRDNSMLGSTDSDGRYSLTAVPPGRFLLAANLKRYTEPNDPTNAFPPSYYPGVADVSQASAISLGAGEKLIDRDLRLLPRRVASPIHVRVVWADGKPVAKAVVIFRDVTDYESSNNRAEHADEQGRFTLNAYEGQTFVIEARSDRPFVGKQGDPMERTAPVRVTVDSQLAEVKIVITKLR